MSFLEAGGPCDMPCWGDEGLICGGSTAFDLYQLVPAEGAEEGVGAVAVVVADQTKNAGYQHEGCFRSGELGEEEEEGDRTGFTSVDMTPSVSVVYIR